ncbi:MAG TPA: YpjP family protein [Bacillales bacterium]|nr:YpjP family protein [Bacillales bacterium]
MFRLLKKIVVTLTAALTFGTFVPGSHVSSDRTHTTKSSRFEGASSESVEMSSGSDSNAKNQTKRRREETPASWNEIAAAAEHPSELRTRLPKFTVKLAVRQGFRKFGPAISNQVGDEYRETIVPKIGDVMEDLSGQLDEDTLRNLVVSQSPSGGFGEKIFHIFDGRNGKDLVRFHVRRDHPPKDGYWFNFHYHVVMDHYENHHELGNIYWDKDTPPKWMA